MLSLLLAVIVGTWNGEWFPSGRAEHRANPKVEAATIKAAAEMIRGGIAALDESGAEDLVLCFNEIRDKETADALCKEIGRSNLVVAAISGYRRRDRFDMQQDVIMTTLPVAEANWCKWKNYKADTPPRGYVHAKLVFPSAVTTTVYAVHLKSNYGQTTDEIAEQNRAKRTNAIEQILEQEKAKRGKYAAPVIIAGDFNADRHGKQFKGETIFESLDAASFVDVMEALPAAERATHPGKGRYPDSTLDYIMVRGLKVEGLPSVEPSLRISDHNAVFVRLASEP